VIFPAILAPVLSQVNEKVYLDASSSYATGSDEITLVEIRPTSSDSWETVSLSDKELTWIFSSAGDFTASVRINSTEVKAVTFKIVTAEDDKLFSTDDNLVDIEGEIMIYLRCGKSSFNNKHREAQKLILEELNSRGLRDEDGNEITKSNIAITKELNAWSRYLALYLIYFDVSVDQNSVYWEKAQRYKKAAQKASMDRQFITIDHSGDGTSENLYVDMSFTTSTVVRR
jgi:hypothetical protein